MPTPILDIAKSIANRYNSNQNSRNTYARYQENPFIDEIEDEQNWAANNQLVRSPYVYSTMPYDFQGNMRAMTPVNLPKSTYKLNNVDDDSSFQRTNGPKWFPMLHRIFGKKGSNGVLSNDNQIDDKALRRNTLFNSISSVLKNAPLFDSVTKYFKTKSDTPDYSNLENFKNESLRTTPVQRYSPTHIQGNLKANQYDWTDLGNRIQAQSATAQNLAARSAGGNTNMLMAHISNLLSNTAKNMGQTFMDAWKANEANRMAVAQENRRSDEFNASADNQEAASYATQLNNQTSRDKQNRINALQYYDQQKYARGEAYKNNLAAARDEMVNNIADLGLNAYERNRSNTKRDQNYWTDIYGIHHYKSGMPQQTTNNIANNSNLFNSVYEQLSDEEKLKWAKMTDAQKQAYIINNFKHV